MDTRKKRKERHRAVQLLPEVRFWNGSVVEIREKSDTGQIIISGTPIVYDTPYTVVDMFGEFEERMAPGVATDLLARGVDCRFLFNHDGLPLARTTAGTMKLEDSPTALKMTVTLDARQQLASDLMIAIERGDVSEMSCGFLVGRDQWDDAMEHREVLSLANLLDVSAVTYPCSPTTSIEVAQRMVLAMPVESRARMRQMYTDVRAGKVLSKGNQDKLVNAVNTLHEVLDGAGTSTVPVEEPIAAEPAAVEELVVEESPEHVDESDSRSRVPATAQERREASESYDDRESAVYQALLAHLGDGDGDCDIWICDCADDWVVYESYIEPSGMFRCSYTIDSDNAVTLPGDPEPVARQTTWVPVEEPVVRSTATLRLQLEARKRRRIAA